jgi:phosphomannomutase
VEPPAIEVSRYEEDKLNVRDRYLSYLRGSVNLEIFNEKSLRLVHDSMHGTSSGLLQEALRDTKQEVIQIRGYRDPLFGGGAPEPVERNLHPLMDKVRSIQADLGVANDGDGDRIALVDERGRFVNTQLIYVLLLLHLIKSKGKKKGKVVKTVSTSFLVDRICREAGIELEEVAVGFKNINEVILREPVIFGGEESGGYGVPELLPQRDGLLPALMILEFMLLQGKRLSELISWVFDTYGRAFYRRQDLRVDEDKKAKLRQLIHNPPDRFAGEKVSRVITTDGLKLVFEDDSWLLLRASGTEPLIRIYAESPSVEKTNKLIEQAKSLFT